MPEFTFYIKITGYEHVVALLPCTIFNTDISLKVFYLISHCKKAHYEAI